MLQPGVTLNGKYVVEKILGQGGMGAVYAARIPSLYGKRVAIKEMEIAISDPTARTSAIKQFQREAHMLTLLDHHGLVDVSDAFEEDGHQYLVMALIDGFTLEDALARTPGFLPVAQVLEWMDQLCDVLSYLHEQEPPVIFRDLKPSNVMLDARNRIRLVDFGIARVFEAGSKTTTFIKGAGTPGFSPVEQFGGGTTDVRSDVYALGATLYTLLTRTVPPVSVLMISGEEALVPPEDINAAVPADLSRIVLKMMGLRKEERYQSMVQVREARRAVSVVATPAAAALHEVARTVLPPMTLCPTCQATIPSFTRTCNQCGTQLDRFSSREETILPQAATSESSETETPPAPSPTLVVPAPGGDTRRLARRRPAIAVIGVLALVAVGSASLKFVHLPGPAAPVAAAGLEVRSQPAGASIKVDGKWKGNAPMTLENVGPGPHDVELDLPHFQSEKKLVRLEAGKVIPLQVALKPQPGELVLQTRPAGGVDLLVDGKPSGSNLASGTRVPLGPGAHQVEVRRTHFQPYKGSVTVQSDQSLDLPVTLKPSPGAVRVESAPSGARVLVDGKPRGNTPLTVSGLPGRKMDVRVEKEGYTASSQAIEVKPDETIPVKLTLHEIPPPPPVSTYEPPVYRSAPVSRPASRPAGSSDSEGHTF